MAVSKVIYNDHVLIDLTKDNVSPNVVYSGYTFHDASGNAMVGTAEKGGDDLPYKKWDSCFIGQSRLWIVDPSTSPPVTSNEIGGKLNVYELDHNTNDFYNIVFNNNVTDFNEMFNCLNMQYEPDSLWGNIFKNFYTRLLTNTDVNGIVSCANLINTNYLQSGGGQTTGNNLANYIYPLLRNNSIRFPTTLKHIDKLFFDLSLSPNIAYNIKDLYLDNISTASRLFKESYFLYNVRLINLYIGKNLTDLSYAFYEQFMFTNYTNIICSDGKVSSHLNLEYTFYHDNISYTPGSSLYRMINNSDVKSISNTFCRSYIDVFGPNNYTIDIPNSVITCVQVFNYAVFRNLWTTGTQCINDIYIGSNVRDANKAFNNVIMYGAGSALTSNANGNFRYLNIIFNNGSITNANYQGMFYNFKYARNSADTAYMIINIYNLNLTVNNSSYIGMFWENGYVYPLPQLKNVRNIGAYNSLYASSDFYFNDINSNNPLNIYGYKGSSWTNMLHTYIQYMNIYVKNYEVSFSTLGYPRYNSSCTHHWNIFLDYTDNTNVYANFKNFLYSNLRFTDLKVELNIYNTSNKSVNLYAFLYSNNSNSNIGSLIINCNNFNNLLGVSNITKIGATYSVNKANNCFYNTARNIRIYYNILDY